VEAAARAHGLRYVWPRAPPFIGRGSQPWHAGRARTPRGGEGYGLLLADGASWGGSAAGPG
jgi:hypothetical protein